MLLSGLLVSVLMCVSPLASSASTAPVPVSDTDAPAAEAAIQAADSAAADADPQESNLASIPAGETGDDREAVEQAQQEPLADQPVENDSSMAAAPGELKDAEFPANAGAVQPPTQDAEAPGLEASSEGFPGSDAQLDASQTEKLAAIEAAAASQDLEALGEYMKDGDAAARAASFDALAAHDNAAAVESLLARTKDESEPFRLQALQLLAASPQVDEQTVMTTLIDALNGADTSFSAYAAQALAERGTPEAMNALSEFLNGSDPSTRLMVLQSVAQTEAGLPLLRAALSDSNETVGSAAAALLEQAEEGEATGNR